MLRRSSGVGLGFVSVVALSSAFLAAPIAQAQSRVGPEFQVNTFTYYYQYYPKPAIDSNGDFVVVWQSQFLDYYSSAVAGQRFAASGAKLGSEFQVNTWTSAYQATPDIAKDGSGNFVVVWNSFAPYSYGQDGHSGGIFAQQFDGSGNTLNSEFQVNGFTSGYQGQPVVARSAAGEFVVVWTSAPDNMGYPSYADSSPQDGDGAGVIGQRFDASGNVVGVEFQVNTYTTEYQFRPAVAKDGSGNFVVVWSSFGQDGDSYGVFGQRFDVNGSAVGGEFQVNSYTTGEQYQPAIASDASGNFVVAWQSKQDGGSYGVFGQRFAANGAPLGTEFQVNIYTTSAQKIPRVAMNAEGFAVVWNSYGGEDGSFAGVFGRHFRSNGSPVGPEFRVNSYTTYGQYDASIAMNANGRFVVAWSSYGQSTDYDGGVVAQRFDSESEQEGKALDFHADLKADLVWYKKDTGLTYLWKMNGGTPVSMLPIGTVADLNWKLVAGGDLNGDSKADLVWVNHVTGGVFLWQMNGNVPTATTPITTLTDLNWQVMATGDTGGDGKADIVWQHQKTGQVYVWRMNGTSVLAATPVATVADLNWRIIGARDFNGDGKADLLWRHRATGSVYVWLMNGATVSSVALITNISFDWRIVAGGDFGGDAKSDLVWQNQLTGQVYLWTMNGGTVTAITPITTVPDLNWRVVGSGDFNGNGKADLVWYNRATGVTAVWIMNGATISTISTVATVADLNWTPVALH